MHKPIKNIVMKPVLNLTRLYFLALSSLFFAITSCGNNAKHTEAFGEHQRNLVSMDTSVFNEMSKEPTVYYFHYTRRCFTCNAVENITKESLLEFYGDKVNFISLNLDEEEGKDKGKELKVSGQTLLIVANGKNINITNEAFMHAKSNPDKLKNIIKATLDPFISK